ncbi:hypothetical protein [Streptomyces prunicolor]|uniref:hypothetical protein n=1 Tax=Streptomyces prunicolor TaxID=67348 RepID=UPI00037476A8|nr:hypothetical protein [Streptomyces prunicolor]
MGAHLEGAFASRPRSVPPRHPGRTTPAIGARTREILHEIGLDEAFVHSLASG